MDLDWLIPHHGLDGRIGWIGYLIRGVFGKGSFWIGSFVSMGVGLL